MTCVSLWYHTGACATEVLLAGLLVMEMELLVSKLLITGSMDHAEALPDHLLTRKFWTKGLSTS